MGFNVFVITETISPAPLALVIFPQESGLSKVCRWITTAPN